MSEWDLTVRFALLGLGTGGLYALSALGIVVIHRGSKTLNFAHGGFAVWGAFLFGDLRDRWDVPAPVAFAVVMLAAAAGGALVYLLVLRPVRHTHPLIRLVATLGVLGVLIGSAQRVFEGRPISMKSSLPLEPISVLGQPIGRDRLILLAIAVGVTIAISVWSSFARLPLATRAMAEHEEAAQSIGVSPHVLGTINWALGAALAAASGALLAPVVGRTAEALSTLVVFALAAALLGRFDSYGWALAGGLVLGVTESLFTHWSTRLLPSGYQSGWAQAAPFLMVMTVLLLQRDRTSNRLASQKTLPVATGRINSLVPLGGAAVVVLLTLVVTDRWLDALVITLCFAILALSLVLLIGYANQISLAHMAIAGLGALAAAQLDIHLGVPFELAPVVGALAGAICGLVVGLPSLRIRGSNLAVVTIGLGLAVTNVVFVNARFTGGFAGLQPREPTVFGIAVDATSHPERYALVVLAWLVLSLLAVGRLRRSKFGRQLVVMRSNERAAASLGISVTNAKLVAFVLSCALAGVGGVLLSFRESSITFAAYSFMDSINLAIVTAIAGIGSVFGAVVAGASVAGGLAYRAFDEIGLAAIRDNYQIIFGVGLCLTIVLHPNGIVWRRPRRPDDVDFDDDVVPAAEPATLDVDDLRISFGGVVAVDGVTLDVAPGEIVGLVGPNGAGKTTLLDGISGFAPTRGAIRLDGIDISNWSARRRAAAGIGRVFQGGELIDDLSVAQNVQAAAENLAGDSRRLSTVARSIRGALDLGDPDALPRELSLAQRRLVAVERTLAGNPRVLLLDEPGAGLSLTDSRALATELRRLALEHRLGILLIDHDMPLVMLACDRIVVLQNGRVLASGTPQAIQASAAVRAAYLGDAVEGKVVERMVDDHLPPRVAQ